MANEKNLKPFSKDHRPKNPGRKKGVPNRATVYKRLLDLQTKVAPPGSRAKLDLSLYEAMALGQIKSAMKGNTRAWQEIQDSLFGKQNNVNLNLTADELKDLSDSQLDDLIAKLSGR